MFTPVFLGLGSNKGNRTNYIRNAVEQLAFSDFFTLYRVSSVYETEPWGFKNQNKFLNCVLSGFCGVSAQKLFIEIKEIEKKLGRTKAPKWHSREIDIDILFFDDKIIKNRKLIIPHSGITERNFVLRPLNDISPEFIHPVLKKSVAQLYSESNDNGRIWLYKKQPFKFFNS